MEELGQLKNSNDLIGTPTRDFPARSIVPQPTTLPCAPTCTTIVRYLRQTQFYIVTNVLNIRIYKKIHINAVSSNTDRRQFMWLVQVLCLQAEEYFTS
jgi:hypothetical protein